MAALELWLGEVDHDQMPATPGQARAIVCPPNSRWLHLRLAEGDMALATTGADGAAPAKSITVQRDQRLFSLRIPNSGAGGGHLLEPYTVYVTSTVSEDDLEAWAVAEDG